MVEVENQNPKAGVHKFDRHHHFYLKSTLSHSQFDRCHIIFIKPAEPHCSPAWRLRRFTVNRPRARINSAPAH